MRYYWNDFQVMPDDLIAFAWSAPMRELAAQLGMSDVGLKKMLNSHGVVCPPQGYWNKVHAGKPTPDRPKVPARRPGETGRIRIDQRFAKVLPTARSMPASGPFASKYVPEDLEELRGREREAIGKASVPRTLDRVHHGLNDILSKETKRREKAANSGWQWDAPIFDNPLAKRRLRILNGIFLTLAKRGHDGDAHERDGEIHARAIVGDTAIGMDIDVHGKHRTVRVSGYSRPAPDLPASTPLILKLNKTFDGKSVETWCDDKDGTLEQKLADIVASIITLGEARFRESLREAERRAEQQRIEAEKRRQEQLAAMNRERIAALFKSGELLRQAEEIRSLVMQVRDAMQNDPEVSVSELSAWENWALAEADRIDPVRSGQFRDHLHPPALPDA